MKTGAAERIKCDHSVWVTNVPTPPVFYCILHNIPSILKTIIVTFSFFPNIMLNLAIYISNNNKTVISEHSSGPTFKQQQNNDF